MLHYLTNANVGVINGLLLLFRDHSILEGAACWLKSVGGMTQGQKPFRLRKQEALGCGV